MIKTDRCEVCYLYDYQTGIPTGEVYIFFTNDDDEENDSYYFEFVVKADCGLAYKTMLDCLLKYGFPICDKKKKYDSLLEQPTVKEFLNIMGCTPYPMKCVEDIEYQYYGVGMVKGEIKELAWKIEHDCLGMYKELFQIKQHNH